MIQKLKSNVPDIGAYGSKGLKLLTRLQNWFGVDGLFSIGFRLISHLAQTVFIIGSTSTFASLFCGSRTASFHTWSTPFHFLQNYSGLGDLKEFSQLSL